MRSSQSSYRFFALGFLCICRTWFYMLCTWTLVDFVGDIYLLLCCRLPLFLSHWCLLDDLWISIAPLTFYLEKYHTCRKVERTMQRAPIILQLVFPPWLKYFAIFVLCLFLSVAVSLCLSVSLSLLTKTDQNRLRVRWAVYYGTIHIAAGILFERSQW